jgi:hypothetical protein
MESFGLKSMSDRSLAQGGYALIMALIGVAGIAGMLAVVMPVERDKASYQRAYAAGTQFAMVVRAANALVNSRSDGPFDTNGDNVLDANDCPPPASVTQNNRFNPICFPNGDDATVSIADLVTANLLPAGFPQQNSFGHDYRINVLWGPPGHSDNGVQWPTAYVFTENLGANCDPANPDPSCVTDPIERSSFWAGVADNGVDIIPNQFRPNEGVDCTPTNPTILSWGTGCLDASDMTTVYGAPLNSTQINNLARGFFMMPAWLAIEYSNNALTRVSIPGVPGTNTMVTDLRMWNDGNGDGTIDPGESPNINNLDGLTTRVYTATDGSALNPNTFGELTVDGDFTVDDKTGPAAPNLDLSCNGLSCNIDILPDPSPNPVVAKIHVGGIVDIAKLKTDKLVVEDLDTSGATPPPGNPDLLIDGLFQTVDDTDLDLKINNDLTIDDGLAVGGQFIVGNSGSPATGFVDVDTLNVTNGIAANLPPASTPVPFVILDQGPDNEIAAGQITTDDLRVFVDVGSPPSSPGTSVPTAYFRGTGGNKSEVINFTVNDRCSGNCPDDPTPPDPPEPF